MASLGGIVGTILGWLGYQMGLRTDTADAAGSLHAKVKYLNDTTQTPRGPVAARGEFSSSAGTTWETALNITGKGKLIAFGAQGSTASQIKVKITVDGYQFDFYGPSASGVFYPAPAYIYTPTGALATEADYGRPDMFTIEFKTSLKIETYYSSANFHYVYWIYVKE